MIYRVSIFSRDFIVSISETIKNRIRIVIENRNTFSYIEIDSTLKLEYFLNRLNNFRKNFHSFKIREFRSRFFRFSEIYSWRERFIYYKYIRRIEIMQRSRNIDGIKIVIRIYQFSNSFFY